MDIACGQNYSSLQYLGFRCIEPSTIKVITDGVQEGNCLRVSSKKGNDLKLSSKRRTQYKTVMYCFTAINNRLYKCNFSY